MHYWLTPVHVRYEITKRAERLLLAFVWRLPRRIVYWSSIRLMANATTGEYRNQVVPDLTAMDALKRWDEA